MKKYLIRSIAISTLTFSMLGCSTFGNNSDAPAPLQVKLLVDQIASGTPISLVALLPMDIPTKPNQTISNNTIFRVVGNVVGDPNSTIMIPSNSLLYAVYRNNGTKCQINWEGLYADYRALELHNGYLGIANRLPPTSCDPKLGIQTGQTITINFN